MKTLLISAIYPFLFLHSHQTDVCICNSEIQYVFNIKMRLTKYSYEIHAKDIDVFFLVGNTTRDTICISDPANLACITLHLQKKNGSVWPRKFKIDGEDKYVKLYIMPRSQALVKFSIPLDYYFPKMDKGKYSLFSTYNGLMFKKNEIDSLLKITSDTVEFTIN